jgi:cytochrome P450
MADRQVPAETVREFDHYQGLVAVDDQYLAIERVRGPRIAWSPLHGGFWIVTTADDYRELLRQTDALSTEVSVIPAAREMPKMIPMNVDPPIQTKYRKVLSPLFSPKAVTAWEPEARTTCRQLIDGFIDRGRCDVIWDYARRLPSAIYLSFMGFSKEGGEKWSRWNWESGHVEPAERNAIQKKVAGLLHEMISERQADADNGDDYPRRLLRSEIDGRRLTVEEVVNICWNLWIAALDTTAGALAQSLHFLTWHDEDRKRLGENLDLIPQAMEELLRMHSFVIQNRTAKRDIQVGEITIRKGDQVMFPSTLASRDPAEFECPHQFQMERFPNRHLAFGSGAHRCLGSHVARMELRVMLEEWTRRIPDYRLAEGTKVKFHGGHLFGIEEIFLEWDVESTRPA